MSDVIYLGDDYRRIDAFIYAEPDGYMEQLELPFEEKEADDAYLNGYPF